MEKLAKDLETLIGMMLSESAYVEVRYTEVKNCDVFEIEVSKAERGRLIGKGGRNMEAIRTLVNAVCGRLGRRAIVEVVE